MKKNLLAKKSLGWYLTYPFAWIYYFASAIPREEMVSWEEFNLGRITHTCKFNGRLLTIRGIRFDECSHFGCFTVQEHEHGPFIEQFRTGNATNGKDEVAKCGRCGDWFVRLYGQKEYKPIGNKKL